MLDIILTKNEVLQKMKDLLIQVQNFQTAFVHENKLQNIPAFVVAPKISRGENYEGLPYLILDYPRYSVKDDFIFIRSFFWWGNFFSSTLQAAGKCRKYLIGAVKNNIDLLTNSGYYLSVSEDPWHHHFREDNYRKLDTFDKKEIKIIIQEQEYIKIAIQWPLTTWPFAVKNLFESWKFCYRKLQV